MTQHYSLQRPLLEPSPSDLARLESPQLAQFIASYHFSKPKYNPKCFTPEITPKFYVYIVQRKEDFLEEGDEEQEEVQVGELKAKQNGDNKKPELNGPSHNNNNSSKVQILLSTESNVSIDPTITSEIPPSEMIPLGPLPEESDEVEIHPVPQTAPAQKIEKELFLNSIKYSVTVPRKFLKNIKLFQTEEGCKLQMIHFKFPRTQMMEAFIFGLEFLVGDEKELSGNENIFELFAVSHILSLKKLQDLCSKRIIKELDHQKVVLAAHLASTFESEKVLRACYRWIGVNLVRKNLLVALNDEYELLNEEKDNISPKRLHFIANHCLSFDYFSISSKIFQPLFRKFEIEKAPYYEPPNNSNPVELVLIRTIREGANPIYQLYDKETNELKLTAIYSAEFGEYIISSSKSLKNLHLDNDSYLGGVRCNLTGTVFTIFNFGTVNAHLSYNYSVPQTEFGIISYGRNLFGWEPREFSIAIPKVPQQNTSEESRLLSLVEKGNTEPLHIIKNKPPKWNEARNTYTLDFRNKVKKASKKNFILETEADKKEVMMMGKIETDKFHLHYYAPFNIILTFGIALSSFHKKLLVK